MCVRTCTCANTHIHTWIHTCTHTSTHAYTPAHTHALIHAHTPAHTHSLIYAYTPAHTHAHTCMCAHTHMRTHAHTDALYLCWLSRAATRLWASESAWEREGPLRGKKRKGSGYLERRTDGALSLPEGGRNGGAAEKEKERGGEVED